MKKFLGIFFIFTVCIVFSGVKVEASPMLQEMFGYRVKNHNYQNVNATLIQYFGEEKATKYFIPNVPCAYFKTNPDGSHFYIKIYPAHKNTDIFVVSDAKQNKTSNPLTKSFSALSYQYEVIKDKAAIDEYKNDFIENARSGAFNGIFVVPDCLAGVKKGITKATKKIKKNTKTTVALPYKNEAVNVNLPCIDEVNYKNDETQVAINSKEYRLKYKENKYAHAFQYMR